MIELQVGKKSVVMPEKLSVRQYKELRKTDNYGDNPQEFLVAMTGLDPDDVKYANKKDMDFVYRFLTERYMVEQDRSLQTKVELEGVEYGLMTDMTSLNFGGWVDLEFLSTDGVEKNMEKIMALMYRPIKEEKKQRYVLTEYDHDEMEERAELFLDAPVEWFWGLSNFFFNLVKAYTDDMKASLEYQRTKEKALTRLNKMNPLKILSRLRAGSTGRV